MSIDIFDYSVHNYLFLIKRKKGNVFRLIIQLNYSRLVFFTTFFGGW